MASLLDKAILLGGLLRGERAGRGPVYVNLDLVARCNNVCLGCYYHYEVPKPPSAGQGRTGEELPLDLAGRLAEELRVLGAAEVVMAGAGEPLLHSRFFDVIAALKRAGLRTQVFTNGTLIDEDMARRLASSRIDILRVSLWAVTEAEHERWHPGVSPRMLEKRLRGIRALAQVRKTARPDFETSLQMPINRENLGALDRRIDIAIESGVTSVGFGYYRAYSSPLDYLALGPSDYAAVRAAFGPAAARLHAAGIRHDAGVFLERVRLGLGWLQTPCYAPWYACSIRVNGDVLVCPRCPEPMGNLNASSLADIWSGVEYRAFRRQAMRQTPAEGKWALCDCANCCWVRDNLRVHRVFKWFAPMARRRAGKDRSG
jgi:MoaA/NifB/PqqE/SkfB family radical SAM enzyme